jgi:hypothetical protein
MIQSHPGSVEPLADFRLDGTPMRYSQFVPRLHGLCRELGMRPGRIMPSRAFCSDESQGYPIILMAKHFGTFPFNHGKTGGIVATDRHGPHAHHCHDMIILQASHVGYDPDTATFGVYRRLQTEDGQCTPSCGKISAVIDWYAGEYQFAREKVLVGRSDRGPLVVIDNLLLREDRDEGLILSMSRLVRFDGDGQPAYVRSLSTAKVFEMSDRLAARLGDDLGPGAAMAAIGDRLTCDLFHFRRRINPEEETRNHLERNLVRYMPQIVTTPCPVLTAAKINTQIEFDRTYRTLVREPAYRGKRVLFVSGLNIDVSPTVGRIFPLTKFMPWAAYWQQPDGRGETWEQELILERLMAQSTDNPDQVNLELAITAMESIDRVVLRVP